MEYADSVRFQTGRHVCQSESGDLSPHSKNARALALKNRIARLHGMKLLWVTLVHCLLVAVLGGGIVLLMAGKPALLLGGLALYALLFAKVGCASE